MNIRLSQHISLNGKLLKLVKQFIYLSSNISSTESDVNIRYRQEFFQAVTKSELYGYTAKTLTKCLEKKLDGDNTNMFHAILNKPWMQHPTKQQLYGNLPPISHIIQIRPERHTWHYWKSKDEFKNNSFQ